MAARLVEIKSAMLLPRHEEAEQLKRELTGELIEYQLCQEAARRLAAHNIGGDLFIRDPEEIEPDYTYRLTHDRGMLLDAYLSAAGRGKRRLPPPVQAFSGDCLPQNCLGIVENRLRAAAAVSAPAGVL